MLVALDERNALTPVPMTISKTSRRVYLTAAEADGTLTFEPVEGEGQATVALAKLPGRDQALLAQLVSHLRPESTDAAAMAGVYLEALGRVEEAEKYYGKAGDVSRRKLEKLFEPPEAESTAPQEDP